MITNNSPVTEGEGLNSNQALTQPVLELVASVGCWVLGKIGDLGRYFGGWK